MDGGSLNAFGGRVELGGLTTPSTVGLQKNLIAFIPTSKHLETHEEFPLAIKETPA
jgi:hypothetical protein